MAARSPRFRLTPPEPLENEIHVPIAKALALLLMPEVQWTCFPAGSVQLPPHAAAKLARMGLKRGWPDFLLIHAGRVHGIEVKRRGGKLSKTRLVRSKRSGALRLVEGQEDVHPRLIAAGMTIGIAHDVDEALALLHLWQIPTRVARAVIAA